MRCAPIVLAVLVCVAGNAADTLRKLNVAVLDHKGQPVTGLQSADFQVQEDGKPRKIAFFRFTGYKPLKAAAPVPGEYSNRDVVPLYPTVVLIDLLNDRLMSGSVIGDESTRYLKNLESSEGLYLYILTSKGEFYPVHPLPNPGTGLAPTSERAAEPAAEPWTRNIGPMLQGAVKNVFGLRPVDERDVAIRFDMTMRALLGLGAQMRQMPGRKNLVWVTHGLPIWGTSISEQGRVDFSAPLRQICQQLEHAQIVVYPVEQSLSGAAAPIATESEQALEEFAAITGGRKYRSGAVGDAIGQAMADSRANYEIAYYPEPLESDGRKPDEKHHKIRVICSRKDVRLQTVSGFYAMAHRETPGDVERAAIVSAAYSPFDATEIGVRASASADPATPGSMRFSVRIDPSDLLLREVQGHRTGRISVLFVSSPASGTDDPGPPTPVDISLAPDQYAIALRDGLQLRRTIPVGASVRSVRAIVFDKDLDAVGSVTIPIQH